MLDFEIATKIVVCSHFKKNGGIFEDDDMNFAIEDFKASLKKIHESQAARVTNFMDIVIGGSNQALYSYLSGSLQTIEGEIEVIKISPKSGLEKPCIDECLMNESYLLQVTGDFPGLQVSHLGLIEYQLT